MLATVSNIRAARCGELAFDFATAALSIADIVLDIAVTSEFYANGRFTFFCISLGIFLVAQACYSFLFAATYGAHLSNCGKICAFIVALPFAQLVPVFALVESFHLPSVGAALRAIGLRPTEASAPPASDTDSLWTLLQRKYHAHAGFLVEALVEAIPQCALQIAAVVIARESSALNVFSILLSLAVIGSKGWLAAYSLHRPTFLFNSLCIAADVAGTFSTAAWLAVWLLDAESSPLLGAAGTSAAHAAAQCSQLLVYLLAAAVCCGVVGGGGTILFSMADDHLKARDPSPTTGVSFDSIFFNVYILRGIAWLLSILPSVTLLSLLRLSLLPLLAFNSLSSEHATHHQFFTALFGFLTSEDDEEEDKGTERPSTATDAAPADNNNNADAAAPAAAPAAASTAVADATDGATTASTAAPTTPPPTSSAASCSRDERLATLNAFIALAHEHADSLSEKLDALQRDRRFGGTGDAPRRRVSAATSGMTRDEVVKQWARSLGKRKSAFAISAPLPSSGPAPASSSPREGGMPDLIIPTDAQPSPAVLAWWDRPEPEPPAVEAMGRWQRRIALLKYSMRIRRRELAKGLAKRSAVFRLLFARGGDLAASHQGFLIFHAGCADYLLLALALLALCLVLLAALPAALLLVVILPFGAAFPIIQLGLSVAAVHPAAVPLTATATNSTARTAALDAALLLPWTLSGVFALLLLLLLLLLPRVQKFQSLRADVAPTAGLPEAFFSVSMVDEIKRRYHRSREASASAAAWSPDYECCICIRPIDAHDAALLEPCGHVFHRACIVQWLHGGRHTCPLCRGHACVEDVYAHELAGDASP